MFIDGDLGPAMHLVNGTTIVQEAWRAEVTYWHVELDAHGLLGGAGGIEFADYVQSAAGVTVALNTGTNSGGDAAGDTLTLFKGVIGSALADSLTGDSLANTQHGGDGAHTLAGGAGADSLDGGGADFADCSGSAAGETVILNASVQTGGDAQGDNQAGFEGVIGSTPTASRALAPTIRSWAAMAATGC